VRGHAARPVRHRHDLASSSASETRIFRLSHVDRADVRLAVRSLELWHELEREAGERVLYTSGLLQRGAFALRMDEALRAEGVAVHDVDHRQVAALFPSCAPTPTRRRWCSPTAQLRCRGARSSSTPDLAATRRRGGLRPRARDRPAAPLGGVRCSRSAVASTPTWR
jgi:hypothetical protein